MELQKRVEKYNEWCIENNIDAQVDLDFVREYTSDYRYKRTASEILVSSEAIINKISDMLPGQVDKVVVTTKDGKTHKFNLSDNGLVKEVFQVAFSKMRRMIADSWNNDRSILKRKITLDHELKLKN